MLRCKLFPIVSSQIFKRSFPSRKGEGGEGGQGSEEKKKKAYLKIGAQKTVEELQESENCLRNRKQRMVISGKYLKNPMETDQIIFYELAPLRHIL